MNKLGNNCVQKYKHFAQCLVFRKANYFELLNVFFLFRYNVAEVICVDKQ